MQLTPQTLRGVVVAIVTPFKPNHDIDLTGAKQLTRFLIDAGVHGIMTTGGNGEFPHMLPEEKKAVTAAIVEESNGAIPIIAEPRPPVPGKPCCWLKMRKQLARTALSLRRRTTSSFRKMPSLHTMRQSQPSRLALGAL